MIADAELPTDRLQRLGVRLKFLHVGRARRVWIDVDALRRVDVLEQRRGLDAEIQLGRVDDVKYAQLVSARGQRDEVLLEAIDRREEVGHQRSKAAPANQRGDALQRCIKIGGLAARRTLEREHQLAQLPDTMTPRQVIAHLSNKRKQTHGVAL